MNGFEYFLCYYFVSAFVLFLFFSIKLFYQIYEKYKKNALISREFINENLILIFFLTIFAFAMVPFLIFFIFIEFCIKLYSFCIKLYSYLFNTLLCFLNHGKIIEKEKTPFDLEDGDL